ncbi:MAG: AtpZ/AtpI family protein [Asticcacaulis sp.]
MTDDPDETDSEKLKDLDDRLKTIEARKRPVSDPSPEAGVNKGYQALGELFGGILIGLGLGWVVDHYVHTTPWGMTVGTILGMVAAIYAIVKSGQSRS